MDSPSKPPVASVPLYEEEEEKKIAAIPSTPSTSISAYPRPSSSNSSRGSMPVIELDEDQFNAK